MKKQLTVYILAALVLQMAGLPLGASAETAAEKAYHKQHAANRESEKAAIARVDAHANARTGHSWKAKWDAHKARHEKALAYKHSQEAKEYRRIARHH